MARKKKHSNNDSAGLFYLITNFTHLVTHLIMFFCFCFGCQRNNISVCNASCHQASWLNMSLKQKKKPAFLPPHEETVIHSQKRLKKHDMKRSYPPTSSYSRLPYMLSGLSKQGMFRHTSS